MNTRTDTTSDPDILVTYDETNSIHTIVLNSEPERDTVDRLYKIMSGIANKPSEQGAKIILDLTHPALRLTPYGQQAGDVFYGSIPAERCVSVAVCITDSVLNRLFQVFMRRRNLRYPHVHERLFTCKENAKAWLCTES